MIIPKSFEKAVKALIFSQGKYLLLIKSEAGKAWDFPGGGVKVGESLLEALVREVKEETGVDIDVAHARPIKKWTFNKDGTHTDGNDFFCIIQERPEIKLSFEHSDFRWLTEREIMDNETIPSWLKDSVRFSLE